MKIYRTLDESLALCSYTRAKRTDPTPAQKRRARKHWHGPGVLARLSKWMGRK